MPETEVLARVRPTPARRAVALAILYALGAMLIYIALTSPPQSLGWQGFLWLAGAGALWLGEKMRRATRLSVELTGAELRASDGRTLCTLDEVVGIERGLFAFKPSNGFVLRLSHGGAARWAPGLWWRVGRWLGVGGVTPSAEGKFMSELIARHLAARDTG